MGSHATVRSWRISSKVQAKHPKLVICHGNQRIHNISKQKLQARWSLGLSLMNLQFSYLFYLILMLDLELYIPTSELDFQLQLWFWFCVPLRRSRKKKGFLNLWKMKRLDRPLFICYFCCSCAGCRSSSWGLSSPPASSNSLLSQKEMGRKDHWMIQAHG